MNDKQKLFTLLTIGILIFFILEYASSVGLKQTVKIDSPEYVLMEVGGWLKQPAAPSYYSAYYKTETFWNTWLLEILLLGFLSFIGIFIFKSKEEEEEDNN